MNAEEIIIDLLTGMEQAIESGDWRVDGACDPDTSMQRARNYLFSKGYSEHLLGGSYVKLLQRMD